VFSLFINAPSTSIAYAWPISLWLVPVILLYWISRVWLKAHRAEVSEDPVVFAIRDKQSILMALLILGSFVLAR
jgi:4-hydroxybenzoate polyprenyltransferase